MTNNVLDGFIVRPNQTLRDTLRALENSRMGIAFVCDDDARLLGTVTDGDVRRALLGGATLDLVVSEVMARSFVSVPIGVGRTEVLDLMRARRISQIPVLDDDGCLRAVHTMPELVGAVVRPNAAIVMAGGRGTRLRPYTEDLPKPMIRVAGRPMLERLVLHLVGHGIRHIYLSVNYLAHMIEDHFGDGERFGCRITYLRESEPLGTAGCLSLLEDVPAHPILIMNGDLVTQADIGRLLDFHDRGGYVATIGARPYAVQVPFGVVDEDGHRLVGLREKPSMRMLVNAGMYVISPETIRLVPTAQDYPITDLFQRCLDETLPVGVYLVDDDWADVGRPEDLLKANGHF